MKKTTNIIALIALTLALVLSFTACQTASDDGNATGKINSQSGETSLQTISETNEVIEPESNNSAESAQSGSAQSQVTSSQKTPETSELSISNSTASSRAVQSEATTTAGTQRAYDLFEAYKNDPSKKQATYSGENIIVNGVITYIGRDSHGTPSINLSDKAGGTGYVLCVFGSFNELDAFSLGQEVTISANFHIFGSDGMVVLKQSKVL